MFVSIPALHGQLPRLDGEPLFSEVTLYRWSHSGRIPSKKIGGRIVIEEADADRFLASLR